MQLYACDDEQQVIFADDATKQQDYFCLECGQSVRRRSGLHRRPHFYHLVAGSACRLSGKSLIHLQVQTVLQSLLPPNECTLEQRFPEINRIADVVWWSQKLVFEIQCSAITSEEVQSRNADYARQGLQVVWILHDTRYNQRRFSAAELYLRSHPFYFTNIDANGDGIFYDQFDRVEKGLRHSVSNPMPIALTQPNRLSNDLKSDCEGLPSLLLMRKQEWPLYFSGDLLDIGFSSDQLPEFLQKAFEDECEQTKMSAALLRSLFRRLILRPYTLFFQMALERACK